MIKISINGNRSDIAGYISYYSAKEIAPLLEIEEKEIVFESAVVDYFAFGDVDFATKVEALVTITDNHAMHIGEINDILAKYLSGFVSEFDIRYQIIDSNLVYSFKVANKHECDCEDDCECGCHHDHCHCHHEEEHCGCGCHEGKECTCEDDCECGCHEGKECTCDDDCECHKGECHCKH